MTGDLIMLWEESCKILKTLYFLKFYLKILKQILFKNLNTHRSSEKRIVKRDILLLFFNLKAKLFFL